MGYAGGFCKFDGREGFKFGKLEISSKFSRQNRDEFDGRNGAEFEADKFKRARCGV